MGALLLVGGNGMVVLAERQLPSSLAALLIASEPFWVVLLGWWWLRQPRPSGRVVLGLLLGFGGVYLLVGEQLTAGAGGQAQTLGVGLVLLAALSWAAGSIYGLRSPVPKLGQCWPRACKCWPAARCCWCWAPPPASGVGLEPSRFGSAAWLGWSYLVVFGSLVAFTAYSWLLKHAPPARVATYAYVNPVVAVLLGWAMLGEKMTAQMLVGAAVIVGSVVLITTQQKKRGVGR